MVLLKVSEFMRRDFVKASPEMSIVELSRILKDKQEEFALVFENGKALGIVTLKDIVWRAVAEGKDPSLVRVKEVMSAPLITASPDTTLKDVVYIMAKHDISRVVVVENGEILGVITQRDLLSKVPKVVELLVEYEKLLR